MRGIDGLASDHTNTTWPAYPNATFAAMLMSVTGSVIGVPANFIILFLSFFSSEITGNYKYFVANLAFLNLAYCLVVIFQTIFHSYHRFADVPFTVAKCSAVADIPFGIGMCLDFALPLTSINRYLVIVRGKEEWFGKKRIALLCLTSYIPMIYPIIIFLFAPYVVSYPYCKFTFYIPHSLEVFLAVIIFVVYPTIMYCNYGIYRVLSLHTHEVTAKLSRTARQVKNERSILKAIVIQGIVPVITALPLGIVFFGVFLSNWDKVTLVIFDFGPDLMFTTTDAAWLIFIMTPTCDALIALLVMKQYSEALTTVIKAFRRRLWPNSLSATVPITVDNSITGNMASPIAQQRLRTLD